MDVSDGYNYWYVHESSNRSKSTNRMPYAKTLRTVSKKTMPPLVLNFLRRLPFSSMEKN